MPAGGHDAEWALVVPHRDRLIAVARARGLSLPDAQDAAHHVMCRAVERGRLDGTRVEAYLVKAVVNRCLDLHAEQLRTARLLARSSGDDRLAGPVDDAVCDRAQAAWLLGKLPARERRVITLSAAGETVVDIAAKTGLSYPTVDRLLSRARKEMRRLAAPLGVVGVAAWRHRRLAVAPATAAVAVVSVTALVLHGPVPRDGAPATPHVAERAGPAPRSVPAAGQRVARPPRTVRAVPVRAAVAPPARPRPPASARVGPGLRVDGAGVSVAGDGESLDRRVERCVRNGVRIDIGRRLAVVCADERKISAGIPPPARP